MGFNKSRLKYISVFMYLLTSLSKHFISAQSTNHNWRTAADLGFLRDGLPRCSNCSDRADHYLSFWIHDRGGLEPTAASIGADAYNRRRNNGRNVPKVGRLHGNHLHADLCLAGRRHERRAQTPTQCGGIRCFRAIHGLPLRTITLLRQPPNSLYAL